MKSYFPLRSNCQTVHVTNVTDDCWDLRAKTSQQGKVSEAATHTVDFSHSLECVCTRTFHYDFNCKIQSSRDKITTRKTHGSTWKQKY